MSVVLWGARKGDVQYDSPEDRAHQEWLAETAKLMVRLRLGFSRRYAVRPPKR